jgi:hypothetical protein
MHGAIPPLLLYIFIAWCLVKHRDIFTFTVTDINDVACFMLLAQQYSTNTIL